MHDAGFKNDLIFVTSLTVAQIDFQVKINGANEEMLRTAAEQFGGRDMDEIRHGLSTIY